jgi:hypothetical protein
MAELLLAPTETLDGAEREDRPPPSVSVGADPTGAKTPLLTEKEGEVKSS